MKELQKKQLEKYKAIKNSAMFQNLLEDMSALLSDDTQPIYDSVFTEGAEHQYEGDIFKLPAGAEIQNVSSRDLLRATKDMVALLRKGIPDSLNNLDEKGMDELDEGDPTLTDFLKITDLPAYLQAVQEEVDRRYNNAQVQPDQLIPTGMTLEEFRILNYAHSVLSEATMISGDLYAQSELGAKNQKDYQAFKAEKAKYLDEQENLVARLDVFKSNVKAMEKFAVETDENGEQVFYKDDLVDDINSVSASPALFEDRPEYNFFDVTEQQYKDSIKIQEKIYCAQLFQLTEKYYADREKIEEQCEADEDRINHEYDDVQAEHDRLEAALKNEKKLEDYPQYADFDNAKYDFSQFGLKNKEVFDRVDEEYVKFRDEAEEAKLFLDEEPEHYDDEIQKVNAQIASLSAAQKEQKTASDNADLNFKFAKETNELRAAQILAKEKAKVDEQIKKYEDVLETKKVIVNKIPDDMLQSFDPTLKELYTHCTQQEGLLQIYGHNFISEQGEKSMFQSSNVAKVFTDLSELQKAQQGLKKFTDVNTAGELGRFTNFLSDREIKDALHSFTNGAALSFSDKMMVMDYKIQTMNQQLDSIPEELQKNKEVQKALNQFKKCINAFNEDYNRSPQKGGASMKQGVTELQGRKDKYLEETEVFLKAMKKSRDDKFAYNEEITELIARAEKTDREIIAIPPDKMAELEREKKLRNEEHLKTEANLQYLQMYKNVCEKAKDWYEFKPGVDNLKIKERFEDTKRDLEERDNRIAALNQNRNEMMQSLSEQRNKMREKINKRNYDALEVYNHGVEQVQQGKLLADRVKRNIKTLGETGKGLVKAKNTARQSRANELEKLSEIKKNSRIAYYQKEDDILEKVRTSKKKVGFNSPLFRKVLSEMDKYQKNKNKDYDLTADNFKNDTQGLRKALEDYIKDRKGTKITDAGYIRLDYVKQLQNCLESREKALRAHEKKTDEVLAENAEIEIKPKAEVELMAFEDDQKLQEGFFEYTSFEKVKEQSKSLRENPPKPDNTRKSELILKDRRYEDQQIEKEEVDVAKRKEEQEKKLAEMIKEAEAPQKTKAVKKEVRVQYIKPVIPDLENALRSQPLDLEGPIKEFDLIMSFVPNNYGFEEFNKGKNFITRYSMDKYIKENKAAEMFMKDHNIQNPMLSPEQAEAVFNYERQMKGSVNLDFGYDEYVEKYALTHREHELSKEDPFKNKDKFLTEKLDLQDDIKTDYLGRVAQLKRAEAKKRGIVDPRLSIPHYGKVYLDDKVIEEKQKEQMEKMAKQAEKTNKIVNDIAKYDAEVAKLNPAAGYKEVPYMDKKTYASLGKGRAFHLKKNNMTDLRDAYSYSIKNNLLDDNMKKRLEAFDKEMAKVEPTEGYRESRNAFYAKQKEDYIKSGEGLKFAAKQKNLVDPRITYAKEIENDPGLREIYSPDYAPSVTVSYININQLTEMMSPEEYDAAGLDVVNNETHYKNIFNSEEYDPLSKKNIVGKDADVEKYPKDLQEKVREYDRILSAVPADYGYKEFERKYDFDGKISREEYTQRGLGKEYFAHMHRLVNPRIDETKAKEIREFDEQIAGFKFDGKEEEYVAKDPKFGKEKYQNDYNMARDSYIIKKGLKDPREDVPDYGRLFLKKSEYQPAPMFDDAPRMERNEKILNEFTDYIQKIGNIRLDDGWEPYQPGKGMDIEKYVSKKEYALAETARDKFILENKIENPRVKYAKYIDNDPELKRLVDEHTKEYRDYLKEEKAKIAAEPDSPEEQKILEQRETERKKTKALFDALEKEEAENRKKMLDVAKGYLGRRDYNLRMMQARKELGQNYKTNEDDELNYLQNLDTYKEYMSEEKKSERRMKINVKRYCDKLTVDDIDREWEHLAAFNKRIDGDLSKASPEEAYEVCARCDRLEELKAQVQQQKDKEQQSKQASKDLDKKLKDPEERRKLEELSKKMRENGKRLMEERKQAGKKQEISAPQVGGPH